MKRLLVHPPPLLVEELAGRGLDLVVMVLGEMEPIVAPRRVVLPLVPRAKVDLRAIRGMRRALAEHTPGIVHCFTPRGLATAVLATLGSRSPPPLVSFRGIATVPSRLDPGAHLTYLSPRVRGHTCESQAVQAGLVAAGIPAERCHVVYNCTALDPPGRLDRDAARDRLGIPRDAFVVGGTAAIRPVKRFDLLLQAAGACLDLEGLTIALVGPVADPAVRRLAADPRFAGRLVMPGWIPDAGGLAAAFDLFVMPSRSEGLCRAVLEAMAAGVCPVVSDAGGMPELVRSQREGLVFPSGDAAALAGALRRLHGDRGLRARLAAAARERVARLCSPAALADRILEAHDRFTGAAGR